MFEVMKNQPSADGETVYTFAVVSRDADGNPNGFLRFEREPNFGDIADPVIREAAERDYRAVG